MPPRHTEPFSLNFVLVVSDAQMSHQIADICSSSFQLTSFRIFLMTKVVSGTWTWLFFPKEWLSAWVLAKSLNHTVLVGITQVVSGTACSRIYCDQWCTCKWYNFPWLSPVLCLSIHLFANMAPVAWYLGSSEVAHTSNYCRMQVT